MEIYGAVSGLIVRRWTRHSGKKDFLGMSKETIEKVRLQFRNTTYYYRLDEMRACGKKEFVVCQVRGGNYVL